MPSQGPLLSTSSSSVANGSGNAWTNPNNINNSDGFYAVGATTGTQYNELLKASAFGFSIPSDGTNINITVRIRGKVSNAANPHSEFHLYLSKDGSTQVGTDRSYVNAWTASDVTYSYGGNAWGTTWTPAEINASTFSVFFSGVDGFADFPSFSVDFIDVTVDYTLPGGGLFFGFFRKAWEWLKGRKKQQVRTFRPQPAFAGV